MAVAVLDDGAGGVLVVTRDSATDPINPPDGGFDTGILRLDAGLRPVPVNEGPGGADPCGALLLGGSGDQTPRAVVRLGPGHFLLAGDEVPPDPSGTTRIFAYGFDASAAALFASGLLVPASPLVSSAAPFAAPDGEGGFFLGWQESTDPEGLSGQVFLGRYDGGGRSLWSAPVPLSSRARATAGTAQAVSDGSGGAFVAWSEWRDSLGASTAMVDHIDRDGRSLWGGGQPVDAHQPAGPVALLVPDPDGVVAVYLADLPRAQRFTPAGLRAWDGAGRALAPPPGGTVRSDLHAIAAGDGSLFVTWTEAAGDGRRRVAAQRLLGDGTMPWSAPVVMIDPPTAVLWRSEGVLGDGSLAVAAVAREDGESGPTNLVAQVIDSRGRLRTPPSGAPLALAPGPQTHPLVLAPGTARDGGAPAEPAGRATTPTLARFLWSDARPGIGVADADAWFVQALRVTSAPRLAPPLAPLEVLQGGAVMVSLIGDDLQAGLAAEAGPGVSAEVVELAPILPDGPGDRLRLAIRVDPGGALGPRSLSILNPDGGATTLGGSIQVTLDPGRVDLDGSGRADGGDLALLAAAFGAARDEPRFLPAADIDGSGLVDGRDLSLLAGRFGARTALAAAPPSGGSDREDEIVDARGLPGGGADRPAPGLHDRERDGGGRRVEQRGAHHDQGPRPGAAGVGIEVTAQVLRGAQVGQGAPGVEEQLAEGPFLDPVEGNSVPRRRQPPDVAAGLARAGPRVDDRRRHDHDGDHLEHAQPRGHRGAKTPTVAITRRLPR
jgi:hypothetical protein